MFLTNLVLRRETRQPGDGQELKAATRQQRDVRESKISQYGRCRCSGTAEKWKTIMVAISSTNPANNKWAKKKKIWACTEILWNTTMKWFLQDLILLVKAGRPHRKTVLICKQGLWRFLDRENPLLLTLSFFFFFVKAWLAHIFYVKTGLSPWVVTFFSRWYHLSRYLLSINKVNTLQKLDLV